MPPVLGPDQIEHAVGDDAIDGVVRNHGPFLSQPLFDLAQVEPILGTVDAQPMSFFGEQFQVQCKVLDHSVPEFRIRETNCFGHILAIAASKTNHVAIAVDADDTALGTNNLRHDVADFPPA